MSEAKIAPSFRSTGRTGTLGSSAGRSIASGTTVARPFKRTSSAPVRTRPDRPFCNGAARPAARAWMSQVGRLEPPRRGRPDDRCTRRWASFRITAANFPCGWVSVLAAAVAKAEEVREAVIMHWQAGVHRAAMRRSPWSMTRSAAPGCSGLTISAKTASTRPTRADLRSIAAANQPPAVFVGWMPAWPMTPCGHKPRAGPHRSASLASCR